MQAENISINNVNISHRSHQMCELKKKLTKLKEDAYETISDNDRPGKGEALSYFSRCISYSSKLIFTEKEIIVFAILQLVAIALGYYLWVQSLDLIPEEVWESAKKSDRCSPVDLLLLLWTFICVGLTAYPLGLLSSCMAAAHFLHETGQESTIAKCFRIVLPSSWTIWIFSWIDGWWTVLRILERLPKKNDRTPISQKIFDEAVYQAWKVASLGFFPATIIGRNITDACKDSLGLLKTHFKTICQLRIAYSLICWVVGIGAYIGGFILLAHFPHRLEPINNIYSFYAISGIPLVFSLFFIQVIFRPIYILSACRIYSNYTYENNIKISLPKVSKFTSSVVGFLILAIITYVAYLFRDELGITQILTTPYK